MPDAYLFDLDGTLVDTAPDLHHALNHTLASVSLGPVGLELARFWIGHGARKMISQSLESLNSPVCEADLDELHQTFLDYYKAHIADESVPMNDAEQLLERLAVGRTPLGVVTNKRYDLSLQLLRALNLYRYIDVLVGGDTLQVSKPAAEVALYACNELEVEPSDSLFVGDSVTDVQCARAAGCKVAIIRNGYNQGVPAESLGADQVFDSFLELV